MRCIEGEDSNNLTLACEVDDTRGGDLRYIEGDGSWLCSYRMSMVQPKFFIKKYKNLRKSDKIIDFNKENINQHKNERGKSKLETKRPYVEFEG